MCVCVRGRRATDVWKEKTHNIGGGGGGVYGSEVAERLMCISRCHQKRGGGVGMCLRSQWD